MKQTIIKPEPSPRILITPGEPAGIGPELCVQIAQQAHGAELIAVADPELLRNRATQLGLPLRLNPVSEHTDAHCQQAGTLGILLVPLQRPAEPGRLVTGNAAYVLETLKNACDGCLSGEFLALVTGPVHKGIINDAGIAFSGDTEFLAERCHAFPVMMLATPGLRVALATTHLPLSAVSASITPERLDRVIRILYRDLRERFHIAELHVIVCGLNPHAGEGGYLGREELEIIEPLLERLRGEGFDLTGPLPADTAFVPDQIAGSAAVLAMYHDHGLPVLKHLGFGKAVNITLGLPIIRTSVDHAPHWIWPAPDVPKRAALRRLSQPRSGCAGGKKRQVRKWLLANLNICARVR